LEDSTQYRGLQITADTGYYTNLSRNTVKTLKTQTYHRIQYKPYLTQIQTYRRTEYVYTMRKNDLITLNFLTTQNINLMKKEDPTNLYSISVLRGQAPPALVIPKLVGMMKYDLNPSENTLTKCTYK